MFDYNKYTLTIIEWEDSRQANQNWSYLSDFDF